MSDFFNKRTIEFVLNREDGSTVYADDFFVKPENEVFKYRNELQKAIKGIREPLFVCYFCGQNIKINGGGQTKKVLHFAHIKDSDFCHIKTDNNYSRLEILRVKFNGAKESPLHFETKNLIKEFIESNSHFSNIKVEKVLKSNTNYLEWKKPDISASYKKINIVFEIQLSTTFLSVIVDREYFYKENQTYILWVFRNFVIDEFKQRFTEKDVFYSNNRNAFVLDDEAINLSQQKNDLYLLCYYQVPIIENLKIHYNWECKYVCFEQLIFDEVNFKVFYFDVDKEERILKEQIFTIEKDLKLKEIAKQDKEEALNLQNQRTSYYDYYYNVIENEELIIDRKIQYINEQNRLFEEQNRITRIELRNGSYITNYQRLFLNDYNVIFDKIFELFKGKYVFTKTDLNFIKREFENKISTDERLNEYSIIYFMSISVFLNRLSKYEELYNSYNSSIQQLLFAILSIKKKRVIGSNFTNLIQIVNHHTNLKNDRVVYFDVIVKAIETYWWNIDEFCSSQDKKGLLKPKILNITNWKPEQDTKYNVIVSIVFPEMKF
ncbi:hypothetical protein SY27_05270 [Flavobacterium sp. 316]|uniref:DUF6035 family protein n=1 Tax=Flavobacterium sp. 316 TaxID=1603293 RepID=UPI0005E5C65B|nr:DUF6035 family protein [Flavobacterium sp. 316]KIX22078.1 hypothetical protein SY27_05270 [Flavobacterium sp. 316]